MKTVGVAVKMLRASPASAGPRPAERSGGLKATTMRSRSQSTVATSCSVTSFTSLRVAGSSREPSMVESKDAGHDALDGLVMDGLGEQRTFAGLHAGQLLQQFQVLPSRAP